MSTPIVANTFRVALPMRQAALTAYAWGFDAHCYPLRCPQARFGTCDQTIANGAFYPEVIAVALVGNAYRFPLLEAQHGTAVAALHLVFPFSGRNALFYDLNHVIFLAFPRPIV